MDDLEKADSNAAMDALENRHRPQLIDTLRRLTRYHLQKDTAFLSQVLLGSVWKVRNGDAGDLRVASLRESQDLYWVQYGLNTLLLFQWSGDTLRLVNMIGIGV